MRTKEDAQDYRYFRSRSFAVAAARRADQENESAMPELPDATRSRFVRQYALPRTTPAC